MTLKIYGIKNCNAMKNAFEWLDKNSIAYDFHDYKKAGINIPALKQAIAEHGWETAINRKGTTWRSLPESIKDNMDETSAITAASDNPSLIKRPLIVANGKTYLGYSENIFAESFKK